MRYGMGVVLVVVAGLVWSTQGLVFRQINEATTWAVLFWRSVGMIPVLLAFLSWRAQGLPFGLIRGVGLSGAMGGLGLVMAFAGAIFSIQSTTIANAVFLFAAAPFCTAILGWLILREEVRRETWAAIALALVGIFIMVREGLAGGAIAGNIAGLISALGFAIFTITLRWGKLADMLPAVVLGGVFSILTAALVSTVLGQTLAAPAADIAWSMGMGAGTLAGGMVLYTLGSRVVPAAESALLSNVEVMLAPVWVWLFLGETASPNTLLGGAILMTAVVFNALSGARRMTLA